MIVYGGLSFLKEGKVNFEFVAYCKKKKMKLNESCCLHSNIKWI